MPPTYPLPVRLTHFLNILTLVVLIGSGLAIFNAHPTLYAADSSDPRHVVLALAHEGKVTLFNHDLAVGPGIPETFPWTLGGWLEGGRRMHFTAAWVFTLNGLLYLGFMLVSRRKRAVWPTPADAKALGPALRDHLRIPPRLHAEGGALNPLQKAAHFAVPVLLAPFAVATGLALSPQWDALFPFWTDLFGGRQFARTWHFASMAALIVFIAGHVLMVAISGRHTIWRMVTGKVVVE